MKKCMIAVSTLLVLVVSAGIALATSWTGSLNAGLGGGIVGYGDYNSASTKMTWTIDYDATTQKYSYDYIFEVAPTEKVIQHIFIETTPNIPSDMKEPVQLWNDVGNLAGMFDDSLYAKKVNKADVTSSSSDYKWEYEFISSHAPVWGDFFAENNGSNGKYAYAYNSGFDGTAFNAKGYIWSTSNPGGKIAVPDGVVPEASTLVGFGSALVMTGPGLIGWLRRRRS